MPPLAPPQLRHCSGETKHQFQVRAVGKVFTTSDGNKYILSKSNVNFVNLRCALLRGGCKGIVKEI